MAGRTLLHPHEHFDRMFFRNLTLFRFAPSIANDLKDMDARLAAHPLKPVGPLELFSRGFVSPFGRGEEGMAHRVGAAALATLGGEDKLLPSAVVNQALAEKLDAISQREGRRPGGRERKRIKDEVLTDLLPRAFARPSRLNGYLDLANGWVVIDSASRKAAEGYVSALREAFGSFPALPANAESSPRALMTAWIAGEPLPEGFELGDECELRDPADTRVLVKAQRHDLGCEEVREHLKAGKQAFRVGMVFEERLSFVLGEDLVIRKLKFLDSVTEQLEQDNAADARAELDAVFALMSGELARLLGRLEKELSLTAAEA